MWSSDRYCQSGVLQHSTWAQHRSGRLGPAHTTGPQQWCKLNLPAMLLGLSDGLFGFLAHTSSVWARFLKHTSNIWMTSEAGCQLNFKNSLATLQNSKCLTLYSHSVSLTLSVKTSCKWPNASLCLLFFGRQHRNYILASAVWSFVVFFQ